PDAARQVPFPDGDQPGRPVHRTLAPARRGTRVARLVPRRSDRMRMHDVAQDLRLAFRALARSPAFSLAVLVTLALGIGASTAIFTVIYGVLLRPLPYLQGERLVHLTQPARLAGVKNVGISPMEIRELRTRATTVTDLVEYHSMPFVILGGQEPERVQTGVVSADFFQTLGVRPLLGRLFAKGEDQPAAPAVLLLGYKYWRTHPRGN